MALGMTTRPEWGSNPPDYERTCGDCDYCIDVGLRDEGLCVQKYEDSADYGDLRVVDFGATACGEWRSA